MYSGSHFFMPIKETKSVRLLMEDGTLDPSYLISELVAHFCPGDLNTLRRCVDIIKNLPNNSTTKSENYYFRKWTKNLELRGQQKEILTFKKDAIFLRKHLNRPLALFKLLNYFAQIEKETPSVPHIFQEENQIPLCFIYVLQGQDNNFFSWSPGKQRFLLIQPIRPTLFSLAKKVSEIGSMVYIIRNYISKRNKLVQHQVSFIFESILQNHLYFVSTLEQMYSTLSPSQMMFLLNSKPCEELKAASIIANTIQDVDGGQLVNLLLAIEEHGDETIVAISRLCREQCMKTIEKMSINWVTKGTVDDPYNEFFIQASKNAETPEEWWFDMFRIDQLEVPKLMDRKTVKAIYSAGKCLNFIKKWDFLIELKIDNKDFVDLVLESSQLANKHMLNIFMGQENLIQKMNDLMDYMLLRRGDFAYKLMEDGANADNRINFILNHFSHRTIEGIKYTQFGSDGPELSYTGQGITSILFSQDFNKTYKSASSLLLKIIKAEYSISCNKKNCTNRQQYTLLFEMYVFVHAVSQHFNLNIRTKCNQFLDDVKNATKFEKIVKHFKAHSQDIIKTCWLSSEFRKPRASLYYTLSAVEEATMNQDTPEENRKTFYEALKSFGLSILQLSGDPKTLGRELLHFFPLVFSTN